MYGCVIPIYIYVCVRIYIGIGTGFLMPGKPAVAAVEGTPEAIARFIKVTRTELFATVPPASRKMTLMLLDTPVAGRV